MTDRNITAIDYYSAKLWGELTQEQLKDIFEALKEQIYI